jgi:hypothetical protein
VTRAEIEAVPADAERAREFLGHARRFLEDADRNTTHPASAVVLYWSACISAMDTVLIASGRRIGRGEDSHAVRVEAARQVLGRGYGDLFERLDEWRRQRHGVSYAAVAPSAAMVAALQADARDMVAAATTYLGEAST